MCVYMYIYGSMVTNECVCDAYNILVAVYGVPKEWVCVCIYTGGSIRCPKTVCVYANTLVAVYGDHPPVPPPPSSPLTDRAAPSPALPASQGTHFAHCSKRSQHSCKLLLHKLLLVVFLLLLLILAVKENKDSPLFQCPTHS